MSNVTFINLPTEILHRIFDYLDSQTALRSIPLVCKRFNAAINSYDRVRVDLTTISQSHLRFVSRFIRPEYVTAIIASDKDEQISDNIDLFFSIFEITQFTRLHSLTLDQIKETNLERFLEHFATDSLVSLTVDSYKLNYSSTNASNSPVNHVVTILSKFFAQYNRLQKFHLENHNYHITEISWPVHCTLSYLSIRECSYDIYFLILRRLSQLQTLIIQFAASKYIYTKPSLSLTNECYPQLTSLTISNCRYSIEEFQLVLSSTPSLVYLKLGSCLSRFDSIFDGYFWEELIQTKLPSLNKFKFCFKIISPLQEKQAPSLSSIIKTFQSPFWLDHKRWLVTCDFTMKKRFGVSEIRLYTNVDENDDVETVFRCEISSTSNIRLLTRRWTNETSKMIIAETLTRLTLTQRIGNLGTQYLAEALRTDTRLHSLALDSSSIDDQGAFYLVNALRENKTLTSLSLRQNFITEQGVQYFVDVLLHNKTLFKLDLSFNEIKDQGAFYLADALLTNMTLTDLKLGCISISNEGIRCIAFALLKNATLATLDIEYNQVDDTGVQYLADAITKNTTLTKLDLGRNSITEQGIKQLFNALQHNLTITTLSLQNNATKNQGAEYLARALQQNRALTILDLGRNQIGNEGTQHLANALMRNTTLTTLILPTNNIGIDGVRFLANALRNNTTLTTLDLSGNQINSHAAEYIADVLRNSKTLISLNLERNQIGINGAQYLADAIQNNTTLTTIILGGNTIRDQGAQYFSETLRKNTTLSRIDLSNNIIQEHGLRHLAETVRNHTILTTLNLAGNQIGDTGAQYIANILENNTTLTALDIRNTGIGEKGSHFLVEALEQNKTIIKLDISYCLITKTWTRIEDLVMRNVQLNWKDE